MIETEIIAKLRQQAIHCYIAERNIWSKTMNEAADEIERLVDGYKTIKNATDAEMGDGDLAREIAASLLKS